MAAKKEKPPGIIRFLADPALDAERRYGLLVALVKDESDEAKAAVRYILDRVAAQEAESEFHEKTKALAELLKELERGPLRMASFLGMLPANGSTLRACVKLQDGTRTYPVVAEAGVATALHRGDTVLLDSQARALLHRVEDEPYTGEVAVLERRHGPRVEVRLRGDDRGVFDAGHSLLQKLDRREIQPGAKLLVNSRQEMAFDSLPDADGLSHYEFLSRKPVPDVVVERDIGAPPAFLDEVIERVRRELTNPTLPRRFRLRRCQTLLLSGVSGSGKTLSILGLWRRLYELMESVTGVPLEQLPPRVFELSMDKTLSQWLGESDKKLARFFQEIDQVADEGFTTPDGRRILLPVLAIIEEADALLRHRGQEPVYDRIMTTLLQKLDVTRPDLNQRLVIFVSSTNVDFLLDPAAIRRLGGEIQRFGRLTRRSFAAVLAKRLRGLPLAGHNGDSPDVLHQRVINDLTTWLFSPNGTGHQPLAELTYAGSAEAVPFARKDFLNGALVDRAVDQAANLACREAESFGDDRTLTTELLMESLDSQCRGIADQLTEQNASQYLTLPDGAHVVTVRRVPVPALQPFDLQMPDHPDP